MLSACFHSCMSQYVHPPHLHLVDWPLTMLWSNPERSGSRQSLASASSSGTPVLKLSRPTSPQPNTSTPRLSRPSSREQILNEYHFNRRAAEGEKDLSSDKFQAKTKVEFQVLVRFFLGGGLNRVYMLRLLAHDALISSGSSAH